MLELDERRVLSDLANARRSHFLQSHDLLSVVVKFYFVAIALAIVVDVTTTSSKFFVFHASDTTFVRANGASFAGILLAYLMFLGLMSGVRGGPVVLFSPELRLIFLSGVNTDRLLRRKAIRAILRFSIMTGATGIAVGFVIHGLKRGSPVDASISVGLYGLVSGAIYAGAACFALGLRLKSNLVYVVGWALVIYTSLAGIFDIGVSPFALVGRLATMFLTPVSFLVVVLCVALVVISLGSVYLVPKADLETIERHSELVSRLRFAIGMRDVRSVILLSRSLSQDGFRARSIGKNLYRVFSQPTMAPVVRSIQSLANWSVRRYIRVTLMLFGGLVVISYAWSGTQVAYLISVPFIYVAGLDLSDPLTSLVDKPDNFVNYPVRDGWLLTRSLLAPIGLSILISLASAGVVYVIHPATPLVVMMGIALTMGIAAVLGGSLGGVRSGSSGNFSGLITPELQAMGMILELLPVAVSAAWFIPALNSHSAFLSHQPPNAQAISSAFFSLIAPLATWAWISNKTVLRSV